MMLCFQNIYSCQSLSFRNLSRRVTSMSRLILPWALKVLLLRSPHSLPPQLSPPFRLAVLLLQTNPKFRARFRLVNCGQPGPEHLKSNVSPKQALPYINSGNDAIILVTFVHISPYSAIENVVCQPSQCFLGEWLRRSAEMRKFWRVNSSKSNMYLPLPSVSTRLSKLLVHNELPSCSSIPSSPSALFSRATNPTLPTGPQEYERPENYPHLQHWSRVPQDSFSGKSQG